MDEIFYNSDLDGNTILLELKEKQYMFIGNKGVFILLKRKIKLLSLFLMY